ncbi:hypothetical protein [Lewinella sp. 4G2]|uniref:hypothetical protein n=1 Tax=Lewinella sp. 4G2 TaxID=1803372 RepID=UPI0007B4C7EF|nr:hypothetical protein [Lewinella sp. 4G2]OAV45700.1 hypothetical protein A3850_014900 [Lewinella sp. 4G2]
MLRFLFTAIAVLTSLCLFAQNPTISIQGTLKDVNGASVSDGDQNITFKIYDALTGGTVIWQETSDVRVTGGIYSHQLGSVDPISGGMFSGPRWLGVVVNGLELTPRSPMSYAPYAMSVNSTQRIAEGGCSGQVGDLKYSYLNPTQFAQVNGDCWVPLDGRAIPGSQLAQIAGITTLPDASGAFLRAQEYNDTRDDDRTPNTPVATFQANQMQSHAHGLSESGAHDHPYIDEHPSGIQFLDQEAPPSPLDANAEGFFTYNQPGARTIWFEYENDGSGGDYFRLKKEIETKSTSQAGNHTHDVLSAGGAETRPENFNFYLYIRID